MNRKVKRLFGNPTERRSAKRFEIESAAAEGYIPFDEVTVSRAGSSGDRRWDRLPGAFRRPSAPIAPSIFKSPTLSTECGDPLRDDGICAAIGGAERLLVDLFCILITFFFRFRVDEFALMRHFGLFVIFFFFSLSDGFHHHLTKRELIQTFGVDSKTDVPKYSLAKAERISQSRIHVSAAEEKFVVDLKPNRRLISPHLKSIIREGNRTEEILGLPGRDHNCHFVGKVISHGELSAAISDCQSLSGVIVADSHFLLLRTIPYRLQHLNEEKHIIFKREAGLLSPIEKSFFPKEAEKEETEIPNDLISDEFCDVNNKSSAFDGILPVLNYTVPPEARLDSLFIFPQLDPITLEIGLFLDSELFHHFRREFPAEPEQHLTEFALALINNVHVLYQQPSLSPNLDIVIVHFELWKTQPPSLATHLHKNGQAQTLLDSFCRHQSRINPGTDLTDPGHWDHGVLLTGYDIYHTTPSVAGVAPVARILFACSLVEGLHLGRSFVLAHEMGHNMGMVHDGVQNQCGRGCCLMSAVNGAGKTTWSSCSVREFNAFMLQLDESGTGNCLRDPAESISSHDHNRDGRLPGQRFTADQQCSYFWGRDYQVEIPNGRTLDDICRILWCGNTGSTISTAHPALEGSYCGDKNWCQEGKCQSWQQTSPIPQITHGGWSQWSISDPNCPVASCQITGSISVSIQLRTCTSPAPNNGGNSCSGSNIRGIICRGTANSDCEGLSRKEYADRLCNSIKNDPIRPDRQLSGQSFSHGSQQCKVWCHVSGSELIRNKGQFPNGSPCGNGRFCVGGNCLPLGCGDKAIVAASDDCPQMEPKKTSKWENWAEWSKCSVSCGSNGIQKRWRKCLGKETQCEGKSSEMKECSAPQCEQYSQWSEWTLCSSCGMETTRQRKCLEGKCENPLEEKKKCQECLWSPFKEWEKCEETSNGCEKKRERKCEIEGKCEGSTTEWTKCEATECGAEWSEWMGCSVSCGIGFQIRERICPSGRSCGGKQARTCNVQDCSQNLSAPVFSEWSIWSPCSASCGQGIQERKRRCLNSLCGFSSLQNEERRCVLRPCPKWAEWGPWNQIENKRKRNRKCVLSLNDETLGCPGSDSETMECSGLDCNGLSLFSEWSQWSECSQSCGGGIRKRSRQCVSPLVFLCNGNLSEEEMCGKEQCSVEMSVVGSLPLWSEWSSWSSCSCFTLKQFRRRFCEIRDPAVQGFCVGSLIEQRPCEPESCLAVDGEWSNWSDWSECSRDCGSPGHQIRNRMCSNPLPANRGTYCVGYSFDQRSCIPLRECTQKAIDGQWAQWSEWNGCDRSQCSPNSQRSRTRYCSAPIPQNGGRPCAGNDFELEPCGGNCFGSADGHWGSWLSWSECSHSCGFSVRQRKRHCDSPSPTGFGKECVGKSHESALCRTDFCKNSTDGFWSDWSEWTESTGCGVGIRSRRRKCFGPLNGGTPCFGVSVQSNSFGVHSAMECPSAIRNAHRLQKDLRSLL